MKDNSYIMADKANYAFTGQNWISIPLKLLVLVRHYLHAERHSYK